MTEHYVQVPFGQVKIGEFFETRPGWGRWKKTVEDSAVKLFPGSFDSCPCTWSDGEMVWIKRPTREEGQ